MRQLYANDGNESIWRLVEDGMNTGLTNTHTARGFSLLYHVFARKQCILSALVIKVTLHYLVLHRFKIHSVSELSRTALLGCRLAASRLREAACWQLLWIANLVVWVQQNTVLICTFYKPSGSSWHSHQTFCLSIPQAGRAKDTKVKGKVTRERAGPKALIPQHWQNRNSQQFKWFFFSVNEVQWTDFVFRILNTHCYHRESLELHQAIAALTIFLLLRLSQHEVFSWQAVLVRESSCVLKKTLPPYLYFLIRSDHRHKCESFDRCVAFKKTRVDLLPLSVFYKYSW